jgi:hypothetical protein
MAGGDTQPQRDADRTKGALVHVTGRFDACSARSWSRLVAGIDKRRPVAPTGVVILCADRSTPTAMGFPDRAMVSTAIRTSAIAGLAPGAIVAATDPRIRSCCLRLIWRGRSSTSSSWPKTAFQAHLGVPSLRPFSRRLSLSAPQPAPASRAVGAAEIALRCAAAAFNALRITPRSIPRPLGRADPCGGDHLFDLDG